MIQRCVAVVAIFALVVPSSITAQSSTQRDLTPAILERIRTIRSVQGLLNEELASEDKLIASLLEEFAIEGWKVFRGVEGIDKTSLEYLRDSWKIANSAQAAEKVKLLSQLLENASQFVPEPSVQLGGRVLKTFRKGEEIGFKLAELEFLRALRRNYEEMLRKLEEGLADLQNTNIEVDRQTWERILRNLYGDPEDNNRRFLAWLQAQELERQHIAAGALKDASGFGQDEPFRVAQGVVIADPTQRQWDLEHIAGVNPDFVTAVQKQNSLLRLAQSQALSGDPAGIETLRSAFWVNKYGPSGSGGYIPAFTGSAALPPETPNSLPRPASTGKQSSGAGHGKTLAIGLVAAGAAIAGAAAATNRKNNSSTTQTTTTRRDCSSLRSQLSSALQSAVNVCRTTSTQCNTAETSAVNVWSQLCSCTCVSAVCNRAPNLPEIQLIILNLYLGSESVSGAVARACN